MEEIHRQCTKRLQQNMAEQEVDAFLILTGADYFYFTGDARRQPRAIIPREGEPVLLTFVSEVEEAREATGLSESIPYRGLHEMMQAIMASFKSLGVEKPKEGAE